MKNVYIEKIDQIILHLWHVWYSKQSSMIAIIIVRELKCVLFSTNASFKASTRLHKLNSTINLKKMQLLIQKMIKKI